MIFKYKVPKKPNTGDKKITYKFALFPRYLKISDDEYCYIWLERYKNHYVYDYYPSNDKMGWRYQESELISEREKFNNKLQKQLNKKY